MTDTLPIDQLIQQLTLQLTFIVGLVMALVEFAKKAGAQGNLCLALSLTFGAILGAGYVLAAYGIPTEPADWFILVIAALIPGLAASGVYDLVRGGAG